MKNWLSNPYGQTKSKMGCAFVKVFAELRASFTDSGNRCIYLS